MGSGFDKLFGNEYEANTVPWQAQQAIQGFQTAYPQLMAAISQAQVPAAQANLAAAKAVTPGYNDLAVGEISRLAPSITAAQGALDAGQAANDIANLNTYGADAGRALRTTDASANPEYYRNLELAGGKFSDALNALSPTLTGGQRAEIERGIGRTGDSTSPASAANTAEKAMAFGSAGRKQAMDFASAINGLSANLGSLRSGISPISTALGRDSRNSPVAAAITPVTKPDSSAYNVGGSVWNGLMGTANANEAIRAGKFKSWGDAVEQDSRSFSNIASGASVAASI